MTRRRLRRICSAPSNRRPSPAAPAGTCLWWPRPPSSPWWRAAHRSAGSWAVTGRRRRRSLGGRPGPTAVLPGELRRSGPVGACRTGWRRRPLAPGPAEDAQFGADLRLPRKQYREAAGRVGAVGAAVAGWRPGRARRPAHLATAPPPRSADRLHANGRAADQLPHRPHLPRRCEDLGRRHRRAQ